MGPAELRKRVAIESKILTGIPLAGRTTLELGGDAEYFLDACSPGEVEAGLAWARARGLPVTILGGGSNVVVPDAGLPGLTLRIAIRGIRRTASVDGETWHVAAGELWDEVVAATVQGGLSGIECLSGIPGLAGAAPVQNIGAYGQEVVESLVRTHVIDRQGGGQHALETDACGFAYRTSRFKQEADRWVVTAIELELRSGPPRAPRYAELEHGLSGVGTATAASIREAVLALRRSKSMVLDPDDTNRRSAGSFFLNPVLEKENLASLVERARACGALGADEELPCFPAGGGRSKVPAAWLIEHAGFVRGERVGNVGISTRHALALVHHGGGSTAELLALAEQIRKRVHARFDVSLVPEPVLLGTRDGAAGD